MTRLLFVERGFNVMNRQNCVFRKRKKSHNLRLRLITRKTTKNTERKERIIERNLHRGLEGELHSY